MCDTLSVPINSLVCLSAIASGSSLVLFLGFFGVPFMFVLEQEKGNVMDGPPEEPHGLSNALQEKIGPTIQDLISILDVSADQIAYSFVAGSRLFGVNRPDSDWDIYVILDGFHGPLKHKDRVSPSPGVNYVLVEERVRGEWDINVYEKSYWQYELDCNAVDAVSSLSIPPEFVLKPYTCKFNFQVDYMLLKHEVDVFRGKHVEISTKLFKKGNYAKAAKIMIHPIRCFIFANQILEKGLVYDHKAANSYTYHVREKGYKTLKDAQDWFFESMFHLDSKFRNFVNKYKNDGPLCSSIPGRASQFQTDTWTPPTEEEPTYWVIDKADKPAVYMTGYLTRYFASKDLTAIKKQLQRDMGIDVFTPYQEFPNLLSFASTSTAPKASAIAEQCQGLVVDMNNDYSVVCYPFNRFTASSDDAEHVPVVDFNELVVAEKMNGISVCMFYYGGKWLLSFTQSTNAVGTQFSQFQRHVYDDPQAYEANYKIQNDLTIQFWDCFQTQNSYSLPKQTNKCFMFIFVPMIQTSINQSQKIAKYFSIGDDVEEPAQLILIGIRNLETLIEEDIRISVSEFGFRIPKFIKLNELEDGGPKKGAAKESDQERWFRIIREASQNLDPLKCEGFIAVDYSQSGFPRIVFKSDRYAFLEKDLRLLERHVKEREIFGMVCSLVQGGTSTWYHRFICLFPQWKAWVDHVVGRLGSLCFDVEETFQRLKKIESQKEFSEQVQKAENSMRTLLFLMRGQNTRDPSGGEEQELVLTYIVKQTPVQNRKIANALFN